MREVLAGLRDPRIATGMWIVILVGLMFGTLDVLAPLRLDELGASAAGIGGDVRGGRRARGVDEPVSSAASPTATAGCCPASSAWRASGVAIALLPWPAATGCCSCAILVLTGPSIGILWTPSMAMISDGADDIGIDQGYAVALINLAWSTGQTARLGGRRAPRRGLRRRAALPRCSPPPAR